MYKSMKIGVVVPCFNEEKLIKKTILTVPKFVDKIIVVDDASKDDTVLIVNELARRDTKHVVLLQHDVNQGVGGAIATGYKWCCENDIDIAVVMAGDAQMHPDDMTSLLEPVVKDETDYAKGNRLFSGDAWKIIPRWRYLGNSALSLLTKIASGYWHIADSQSGYTAINRKALERIDWGSMYKRYGQPNDLLVRLNVYNFRVRDVPIKAIYNIGEESGIKPLPIIPRLFFLLVKLFFWRMYHKYIIRDFHPLIFFYALALFLIIISVILFGRLIVIWNMTGAVPPINALTIIFTGITAFQSVFFAMWFDMDYNKHLR